MAIPEGDGIVCIHANQMRTIKLPRQMRMLCALGYSSHNRLISFRSISLFDSRTLLGGLPGVACPFRAELMEKSGAVKLGISCSRSCTGMMIVSALADAVIRSANIMLFILPLFKRIGRSRNSDITRRNL